jgi:hypothetical protein
MRVARNTSVLSFMRDSYPVAVEANPLATGWSITAF